MTKVQITKSMFDQLEYDTKEMNIESNKNSNQSTMPLAEQVTPTVMFVFDGGDLNSAAYHLIESLKKPINANPIATVFVEESIRSDFIGRVQPQMKSYTSEIAKNAGFAKALEIIKRFNFKTIVATGAEVGYSPTIVCDIAHEHLGGGKEGGVLSGVVTLHTFRTVKESIALCGKESINFTNATIWNKNHSCAYELVSGLRCANYFINCYQVPLKPLTSHIASGDHFVTMDKSYHYETMPHVGVQKSIVFPIVTIFAN